MFKMARTRYISNSRGGISGSIARGNMIYTIGGGSVGGGGSQNLHEVSTTKKYNLGTRLITGDGRVFKYGLAGGTLVPDNGVCSANIQQIGYSSIAVAAAIGATSISITAGETAGAAADGVIAENELAGGYFVSFTASVATCQRRLILSNEAVASGGGTLVVVLDEGLHIALTTSDHAECMASPYYNLQSGNDISKPIVGVPVCAATVGQYCWIQTWGPCWVSPQATVGASGHNQVVFRHDGSLDDHDYSEAYATYAQHAGFVLSSAASGAQAAPFIMLQISI